MPVSVAPIEVLNAFLMAISFVLGSMIGSFLNVCVYRLPRNESIVSPRSRCPRCGSFIAWYDNIPMLSWLLLGARCRRCHEPISWQYPVVEALTAVLFTAVYWRFGIALATPVYFYLVAGLVLITFVDLTDWTIPNEVTIPGFFIGIACAMIGMGSREYFQFDSGLLVVSVFDALIGAALGAGILFGLDRIALWALKKHGMGFGDVKLLAMLGAFLGWKAVFVILMLASIVGGSVGIAQLALRKRDGDEEEEAQAHYLPFGPYLALGGVVFLFFGKQILDIYLGYSTLPEPDAAIVPLPLP